MIQMIYRPAISLLVAVVAGVNATAQVTKVGPDAEFMAPRRGGAPVYGQPVTGNGEWLAVSSSAEWHPRGPLTLPRGAVHLYRDVGETWQWTQSLWAPTAPAATAGFGASVAFGGRGELFIGMPDAATNGPFSGAVLRYECTAGIWNLAEQIDSPLPGGPFGSSFGTNVSYRDGRLLVVAPSQTNPSGAIRGRICVYERLAGAWTLTLIVEPPNPNALSGRFRGVKDAGDYVFAALTAPNHVLVYRVDAGGWTLEQSIPAPLTGGSGGNFGGTLDYSNGVLAIADDGQFPSPGAVFLYEKIGGQWTQIQSLSSGSIRHDLFGRGMSMSGSRLLIGVALYHVNVNRSEPASALLYEREQDGEWILSSLLQIGEPTIQGTFGESVFIGQGYALVGDTLGGLFPVENAGTVSVYSLPVGRSFCNGASVGGQSLPELQLRGAIYAGAESVTASVSNVEGYDVLSVYGSLSFTDRLGGAGQTGGGCLAGATSFLSSGPRVLSGDESGAFECDLGGGTIPPVLSGTTIAFQSVLSGAMGATTSNAVAITLP